MLIDNANANANAKVMRSFNVRTVQLQISSQPYGTVITSGI